MRLKILAVGRLKDGPERTLFTRYMDRARNTGRALGWTGPDLVELPESRHQNAEARKQAEAQSLLGSLGDKALLIALDERGKSLTSETFASRLGAWREQTRPEVNFAIGGADGLDPEVRERADLVLSFSPMTWPHQMVRLMLAEQLYRATSILSNHPYHRGG